MNGNMLHTLQANEKSTSGWALGDSETKPYQNQLILFFLLSKARQQPQASRESINNF